MEYHITFASEPSADDLTTIREGLSAFNKAHAGDGSFSPINLFVYDSNNQLQGGLLGGTYWGYLVIEILWLADMVRQHGLGSQLVQQAEQIAIARGCHAAHLDTMSFQAPAFYQKLGYQIYGVLEDLPTGHQRYFLKKRLSVTDQ